MSAHTNGHCDDAGIACLATSPFITGLSILNKGRGDTITYSHVSEYKMLH